MLAPDIFSHLTQKAFCLVALNRVREAREVIEQLSVSGVAKAADFDTLGNLHSLCRDQLRAESCFRKAVELEPGRGHYWANLALALQANGDLGGAEGAFDRAIELAPEDYEAWLHRSRLRKQSLDRNHVSELEAQLTEGEKIWRAEMALRYALAKEYEDLEDYPRAFDQLQYGSRLRRSHMQHDNGADLAVMEAIIRKFSADYLASHARGCDSGEPIFIVGLPRTGTTLVERILGSHSEVFAAGELNNFAECLSRQVARLPSDGSTSRQEFVEASAAVDYNALGQNYVESTRPYTGDTPRFVDKLPLNFLYCGLILRALPNAKIIHLTRDPMDTCFAVYKTLFKQAYPFSYDLEELGQYYLAYRKLMLHWHSALPGRILDVNYEELTGNLEQECRRIFSYCGLEWENACLEFHTNTAPSMTASLAQVRQPVYRSSVGRWKHYREELKPLEAMLKAANAL